MYSTMQDFPLTIAAIMRHGCGVHGARTATTATAAGYRRISYREVGQQAAQLASVEEESSRILARVRSAL